MKSVAIVSGGLDSVSLAYMLAHEGDELHLLSFDYGQRHRKELHFARLCAERLGVRHDLIDVSHYGRMLVGSALTDDISVPHGHYAEESMRITVVPNRNAIMLALAFGVAVGENAQRVAYGAHGGDHFIYPDCRPAFVEAFAAMETLANEGFATVNLHTPFLRGSKADIVTMGAHIGVPFAQTWSCYEGGDVHCGRCGTCVERKHAFRDAGVSDPTVYQDPAYGYDLEGPQRPLAIQPKSS